MKRLMSTVESHRLNGDVFLFRCETSFGSTDRVPSLGPEMITQPWYRAGRSPLFIGVASQQRASTE